MSGRLSKTQPASGSQSEQAPPPPPVDVELVDGAPPVLADVDDDAPPPPPAPSRSPALEHANGRSSAAPVSAKSQRSRDEGARIVDASQRTKDAARPDRPA